MGWEREPAKATGPCCFDRAPWLTPCIPVHNAGWGEGARSGPRKKLRHWHPHASSAEENTSPGRGRGKALCRGTGLQGSARASQTWKETSEESSGAWCCVFLLQEP